MDDPSNVSDWLWDLIGRTDTNSEALRDLLRMLPDDKVRRFALEFRFAASLLQHEKFIRHVDQGNLSEDNVDDLGYWVVSHGKDYLLEVRRHPETLVGYLAARQTDPTSFEFIAESILEERLGEWPEDILDHWEFFCDSSYARVSDYWEAQQEHEDVPAHKMDRQSSELDRWQLVKVGAYEQALPLFQQQALSADARGPDLGNLGILYLLLREYRSALSCFTQAAEITEQYLATDAGLIAQGICYWALNDLEHTVCLLRQALRAPYTDAAGGVTAPALLLYVAERTENGTLRKEALAMLRQHARRKLGGWPGPIVPFLLGKLNSAVLDGLAQEYPSLHIRRQCVADFYIALRALREGDQEKFRSRMQRACQSKDAYLEDEYHLARWEVDQNFPFPAFLSSYEHNYRKGACSNR